MKITTKDRIKGNSAFNQGKHAHGRTNGDFSKAKNPYDRITNHKKWAKWNMGWNEGF